ncbi:hypothetical protein PM082_011017 [Marasmius tenuissimus]|nr:hypothetical protein PM082_011017 [Marasmius tenuissimus]
MASPFPTKFSPAFYSCINIQTILNSPSSKCFQWTPDGQGCFVTKSAVYIITPEPGINHDLYAVLPSALQGATLSNEPKQNENGTELTAQLTLNWFRTMIQYDLKAPDVCRWPDFSQEFSAVSLGSIDPSIWSVTFSPSDVAPNAGCIMAILTANMDLSLWRATKNALKGEWIKILDIPPILLETFDLSLTSLHQTLSSQVVSIEWTQQADFRVQPTPRIDGSLLICGSRAGMLIFLRFNSTESTVDVIDTLHLSKEWITHISATAWTVAEPGICRATVAYTTSLGNIGVVDVTQTLSQPNEGQQPSVLCALERPENGIVAQKAVGVTALKWFEVPNRGPILAYTTPGLLRLWSSPLATETPWSGTLTFVLKTPHVHVASSSMHPAVGLEYLPLDDTLLICLLGGSFQVVKLLSTAPTLDEGSGEEMTRSARRVFERVEYLNQVRTGPIGEEKREKDRDDKEKKDVRMTKADANTTCAMSSYDAAGVMVWIHEPTRPADFSYKHDAKHNSMLVVARLRDGFTDAELLGLLTTRISTCKTASGFSPLHILRPVLFHMRSRSLLDRLHAEFIRIFGLQEYDSTIMSDNIDLTALKSQEISSQSLDARRNFRKSLTMHLFGWDLLMSLRMRLSLADCGWKLTEDPQKRVDYGDVAGILLTAICHRNLRTMLKHLAAVTSAFTIDDVPFVLRMVVQSLLPGAPPELSAEGENLSTIVHAMFDDQATGGLNELCPACHVQVPLENIVNAKCSNGHVWSRCSVTTFILSTPDVRTCIGCTRKAFLPLCMHKTTVKMELKGWFVEELLEAVQRCLFCGNAFVSVL